MDIILGSGYKMCFVSTEITHSGKIYLNSCLWKPSTIYQCVIHDKIQQTLLS